MKQTVVSVFDSPLKVDEAMHELVKASFLAERLPRIDAVRNPRSGSWLANFCTRIRRAIRDFLDADMYLQAYAEALAEGRWVIKVYVDDNREAWAAKAILEAAGGTGTDFLADEPIVD